MGGREKGNRGVEEKNKMERKKRCVWGAKKIWGEEEKGGEKKKKKKGGGGKRKHIDCNVNGQQQSESFFSPPI